MPPLLLNFLRLILCYPRTVPRKKETLFSSVLSNSSISFKLLHVGEDHVGLLSSKVLQSHCCLYLSIVVIINTEFSLIFIQVDHQVYCSHSSFFSLVAGGLGIIESFSQVVSSRYPYLSARLNPPQWIEVEFCEGDCTLSTNQLTGWVRLVSVFLVMSIFQLS